MFIPVTDAGVGLCGISEIFCCETRAKWSEHKLQQAEVISSHLNRGGLLSELADWAVELEARPVEYLQSMDTWQSVEGKEQSMVAISYHPFYFYGKY